MSEAMITTDRCGGCGAFLDGNGYASEPAEIQATCTTCRYCPPQLCETCGQLWTTTDTCPCWALLDDMARADVKALFACDCPAGETEMTIDLWEAQG